MKNKRFFFLNLFILSLFSCYLFGQAQPSKEELEKGYNFLETKTYSQEENLELLKLFVDADESDVCDAMDMVGLPNTGLVDPEIGPVWTDPSPERAHRIVGIAVTCRYVPTQRPNRPGPGEEFRKWSGSFYSVYSPESFKPLIQKGTVIVRDGILGREDSGIGSNNALAWIAAGAVGVVTNSTTRDIDEITLEKIPVYYRERGRGIRPGRSELESVNRPVNIGGVLVCPGDVIVADGDGVIVVPRAVAWEVGKQAQAFSQGDKAGRKRLYEKLGIPLDETVK